MSKLTQQGKLRLAIKLTSILALLSMLVITASDFAYGSPSSAILFLIFYLLLFISSILTLTNSKISFVLVLLISISYSFLLTNDAGNVFLFRYGNWTLVGILLLPYLLFLFLIGLITRYLVLIHKLNKYVWVGSILLVIGFPVYSICERANKDYIETIYADVEFKANGVMKITCAPSFADSRQFQIITHSKEFAMAVKSKGKYYQGSYQVPNLRISRHFHFHKLISFTIYELGSIRLHSNLTWNAEMLEGDSSFLLP